MRSTESTAGPAPARSRRTSSSGGKSSGDTAGWPVPADARAKPAAGARAASARRRAPAPDAGTAADDNARTTGTRTTTSGAADAAAGQRRSVQRMTRVDTAWLRMDSPENLMMIVGVWLLEPRVTVEAVRARVAERLLAYPRFRQRVEQDAMGANWVEDGAPDLSWHVTSETLPRNTLAALRARVGKLAATPLDPSRPLWQFNLIEDFGNGRSALIARVHHCIGDGIALISVLLTITDGGAPPPMPAPDSKAAADGASDDDWLKSALIEPFTKSAVKALNVGGDLAAGGLRMVGALTADPLKSIEPVRMAGQALQDVVALAAMPDDSPTRLKGKPGGKKVVAWCEPLPLAEVKTIGKALGCSVNDVLLGCVSGAIGGYLRDKGDATDGVEIRAMVPVNLRPLAEAWKLGNRFGLVPLVLPVGIDNPVARVFEVNKRMNELKGSYQPLLAFSVLAVAGLLIKPGQDALLGLFSKKATAVMTNVPGPAEKLKFCGSTLEQTMFWVPQSGDIGMGVSILSYGGGVQFGLITDAALCPDPQKIIDRFAPEFERLLKVVLLLPWA
jgi:WS/DGAT/MGAT family acyltransferase